MSNRDELWYSGDMPATPKLRGWWLTVKWVLWDRNPINPWRWGKRLR